MYSKILVPLDGSALAETILPYVSEMAQRLDAGLVLMTAIDDSVSATFPRRGRDTSSSTGPLSQMVQGAESQ